MNSFKILILITLGLITRVGFSQVNVNYETQLKVLLNPVIDRNTTQELAHFISKPFGVPPEQSIRIVKMSNRLIIEGRTLSKNLWEEGFNIMFGKCDGKPVESYLFSAQISSEFMSKMVLAFTKVIALHQSTIKPKAERPVYSKVNKDEIIGYEVDGADIFDGTSYEFSSTENNTQLKAEIACPLDSTDYRYLISNSCLQIINDLRDKKFDEAKYPVFN